MEHPEAFVLNPEQDMSVYLCPAGHKITKESFQTKRCGYCWPYWGNDYAESFAYKGDPK